MREAGEVEPRELSHTRERRVPSRREICCNAEMGPALTVLLIAASTALAAQSAAPPARHQSPPDGSTVTVTGCLTKSEPAGSFILTSVHFDSGNTPTTSQGQHHERK